MTAINYLGLRMLLPLFGSGITYLLRDEFTTTEAAPMTSPRTAEPGPGTWTIVDATNKVSIASGKLMFTLANTDAPRVYGSVLTRVTGRTMLWEVTPGTAPARLDMGFADTAGIVPNGGLAILVNLSNGVQVGQDGSVLYLDQTGTVHTAGESRQYAIVIRSAGGFFFTKGGTFTEWTLLFVLGASTDASLYPSLTSTATAASTSTFDYARVVDLGSPFNSDYGIAVVDTQTFTQALGAELLTNPGPTFTFTADNPDGYTVTGESGGIREVTEVASGGGAGTGSLRLYNTDATLFYISQGVLSVGSFYEASGNVSAVVGGSAQLADGNITSFNIQSTVTGVVRGIRRALSATALIRCSASGGDITFDSLSYKLVTLNSQSTAVADGVFDFSFTLPASPRPGERCELWYRANGSGDFWTAYVERNVGNTAWDLKLDSVSSGVYTNRITVTGVGTPIQIRVIASGNLHNCYTLEGTTWTKRGAEVNNSTHATNTGVRAVYSSTVTPSRLTVYPRTGYSSLDTI